MIRGFVLLLVLGVFVSMSGCTMNEVMGVKQDKQERYEPKPNLSAKENHALKTWAHAAATADEVGDCTTASLYYTKIADYFPDTKEGRKAQSRLDEMSGEPKIAEEENSL